MRELTELQHCFQNHLLRGGHVDSLPIVPTKKVSSETRMGIYYDGYRIRLREALGSNYPCLLVYLGEAMFNEIADAYLADWPSTFRSIRWFGDHLPDFLKTSEKYSHDWLVELADLEWKMAFAFDAADEQALTIEDIAVIPPECWSQMRFTVHPSLQRFNAQWNSVEIWQNLTEETPVTALQKLEQQECWVIWRRDYINRFYVLNHDEQQAFDALLRGDDFATICSDLCTMIDEQEVIMRVASFLKGWIQSGLLTTVTY